MALTSSSAPSREIARKDLHGISPQRRAVGSEARNRGEY